MKNLNMIIALAFLVVVGCVSNSPSAAPGEDLIAEPVLGSLDAPVTITEHSDFECPYCGRFHQQTFSILKDEYIDTGKVKFIYSSHPLASHRYARKAAEAGECALEQGKFWEYSEILYENQYALTTDHLKYYAETLNLDQEQFDECLDSGKYKDEVQNDLATGIEAGVEGTPSFFVNGKKLEGAQPFSEFQKVIEAELNK